MNSEFYENAEKALKRVSQTRTAANTIRPDRAIRVSFLDPNYYFGHSVPFKKKKNKIKYYSKSSRAFCVPLAQPRRDFTVLEIVTPRSRTRTAYSYIIRRTCNNNVPPQTRLHGTWVGFDLWCESPLFAYAVCIRVYNVLASPSFRYLHGTLYAQTHYAARLVLEIELQLLHVCLRSLSSHLYE